MRYCALAFFQYTRLRTFFMLIVSLVNDMDGYCKKVAFLVFPAEASSRKLHEYPYTGKCYYHFLSLHFIEI